MNTKKYRPVLTNMLASLKANLGILAVLVIMVAALSLLSPVFLTQNNILSVGRQMFSNICLSLGMTFVIIIGGIDLSVGAIVALSGITSVGLVINGGWAVAPAVIAGILIGTLCGILNGCIISWLKVPAFIVTMAMMNVARGAAQIYTGGTAIRIQSVDAFTQLGVGRLFNVPYQIYYAVVLIILATLVLNRTKFGTYVFATGGNRLAARLSGIKTARIERITYTISGTMAGITGVILSARMYSAQPSVGDSGLCARRCVDVRWNGPHQRHHHRRHNNRPYKQWPEPYERQLLLAACGQGCDNPPRHCDRRNEKQGPSRRRGPGKGKSCRSR